MGTVSTTGGGVSYVAETADSIGAIPDAEKGAANGVATLDGSSKVPVAQIPALGGNPSASAGLAAVNGVATTYMRSDGAPAISQAIAPTWSGVHQFTQAVTLTAGVGSVGGVATVGLGVAALRAAYNAAAQAADIAATTLFAVPASGAGMYRVSAYAVVTQAATTSSTLPNVGILWTDGDTSVALSAATMTPTNTANAPGAFGNNDIVIFAAASTNIRFQTSNYASSGATPMQYAIHLKLEYLG
ncbi:hypothetical protein OIU35_31555 [Boseaceae bacterium BT-24-1]|nr:hypothetical protein [Boseaceae bacterium BT-24-1]